MPPAYSQFSHVARPARIILFPSAPQHEYWLVYSGATNHMTSDITNLQEVAPYSSSEIVTGAGGEGLAIAHIGNTSLTTQSHQFQLKSMLHVPQLSHYLLSMNQLCRDNKCRCIVDEFSICIQDKATGQMLYQGLSNNAVYPLLV